MYICSYTRGPRKPRLIPVFIILSIVVEAKCVIKSKLFISNLLAFLCRTRSLISSVPVTHPLLLVPCPFFFFLSNHSSKRKFLLSFFCTVAHNRLIYAAHCRLMLSISYHTWFTHNLLPMSILKLISSWKFDGIIILCSRFHLECYVESDNTIS